MKVTDVVYGLVKPECEKLGLILWDVEFVKEGASYFLRIYIDSEKGVGIEDCTNLSHAIDPVIDEADPIDKQYYLEVCSAGLGRKIATDEHLSWAINKEIEVKLYKAVDGVKQFTGTLQEFNTEQIVLLVGDKTLPLERKNISKMKLNDDNF